MSNLSKWFQKQNPYVWLIVGGPSIVIVASFITLYLAITNPDPAIDDYYRKGIEINKTLDAEAQQSNEHNNAMTPAVEARNHVQSSMRPADH